MHTGHCDPCSRCCCCCCWVTTGPNLGSCLWVIVTVTYINRGLGVLQDTIVQNKKPLQRKQTEAKCFCNSSWEIKKKLTKKQNKNILKSQNCWRALNFPALLWNQSALKTACIQQAGPVLWQQRKYRLNLRKRPPRLRKKQELLTRKSRYRQGSVWCSKTAEV